MTTVLVTTDFTTTGTATTLVGGQLTWVMAGVERISTGGNGASASSNNHLVALRVDGTLYGDNNGVTILGSAFTGSARIMVGEAGKILGRATGVLITATDSVIANYGEISSVEGTGCSLQADNASVENHGTISSLFGTAMAAGHDNAIIFNDGHIGAPSSIGIDVSGLGSQIFNAGTIHGVELAIRGGPGNDIVVNQGTLSGGVNLGSGIDRFDGSGGGGTFEHGVNGGFGGDNLRGSDYADALFGDSEGDAVIGLGGDDFLSGDSGSDTLRGGAGEDAVLGGSENDRLFGGGDDDNLIGGTGVDRMTGGTGADRFVFANLAEIGLTPGARDRIEDFTTKVDKIDLSSIAGLDFIAGAAFGSVAGQVRYAKSLGEMQIDINGDAIADAVLDLGAGTTLALGDLILV